VTPEDHALRRLATTLLASGYRFISPTPETHRRVNARPANAWARDITGVFGWSRPFRTGTLPEDLFALGREAGVFARHSDGWRSDLRLSTLGDYGFFHSAYPTHQADSVFFGPDTYRFAAALTAYLRDAPAPRRAVDICCGAGPGAVVIATVHPQAETMMLDINPKALHLARINAMIAGAHNVEAGQSDLLSNVSGSFDLIVANPPYLADPQGRLYRDGGGGLGAGLSLAIVAQAAVRLAPGGTLLLYTGTAIVNGANPFLIEAATLLSGAGLAWRATELDPDVFGEELDTGPASIADRIAVLCLIATKPR
jgi:release factor glutamine methyltransferase